MYSICQFCNRTEEYDKQFHMKNMKNYKDSSFSYCEECYNNLDTRCEICNTHIQGYTCEKDNDYFYICYSCKCNDLTCEYC
jgi:hypothetical protein